MYLTQKTNALPDDSNIKEIEKANAAYQKRVNEGWIIKIKKYLERTRYKNDSNKLD